MHTQILVVLLGLGLTAARASTIENFVVVNSSNPNIMGGVFDNNDGRYYGSFSLDVSQVPEGDAFINLTSFDMFTTGIINFEFSSSDPGSGGLLAGLSTFVDPSEIPLQDYDLVFQGSAACNSCVLILELVEQPGTFHGGIVLEAQGFSDTVGLHLDSSASALIIDPAVLAPEPSSGLLAAVGVGHPGGGGEVAVLRFAPVERPIPRSTIVAAAAPWIRRRRADG